MKQIIVNVCGLSEKEKQQVNEALAKITDVTEIPATNIHPEAGWFFAPSTAGLRMVTWGPRSQTEKPTHTPEEVLEMAGMSTKRKVRKDFDSSKGYSVDVSLCTEEEKKEVQQAFFDAGFPWMNNDRTYHDLDADMYTNVTKNGKIAANCMWGETTEDCNMTAKEFLERVYGTENQGHVHADLMVLYAEDAKTTDKPWELWQIKVADKEWRDLTCNPSFATHLGYRRKPKTHIVNDVEVPDLRFVPKEGEEYYVPHPIVVHLYLTTNYTASAHHCHRVSNNLCYEYTEEGRQAAILHAKAMLGIN